jgi:hypothetical protein
METLKVIVSGSFKEKALLASILNDKLKEEGVSVIIVDAAADMLVRTRCGDILKSFKETDSEVKIVVENLINTNVTEDVKTLLDELKTPYWQTGSPDFNKGVKEVESKLRQILMI